MTVRGQSKCDGTRAENRFRLSAKWTSPFKSAGASVQSTTGGEASNRLEPLKSFCQSVCLETNNSS